MARFNEAAASCVLQRCERLIAFVLIAVVLALVCLYMYYMATTSLWNDELYSIRHFSSQGIWHVLSDYHVPNNHIFFNLLNVLTPVSDPYTPLTARFLSFVSVLACFAVGVVWLWRRGLLFEAGVFVFVGFANVRNLDLMMEARGYGLICLFAICCIVLVCRYLEAGSKKAIWTAAGATILGTWTVPTFMGFGGPLMFLAFALRPRWNALGAGALAATGVIAVHLPVVEQIIQNAARFGEAWGRPFATWTGVESSASLYLFPNVEPAWAFGLLVVTLSAILLTGGSKSVAPVAQRAVALSVIVFFAGCLVLETPLVRTTQFVAIPVAFLAGLMAARLLAQTPSVLGSCTRCSILGGMFVLTINTILSLSFTAKENWQDTAEFINTVFPQDIEIAVPSRKPWLDPYLEGVRTFEDVVDIERFAMGRQIVVADRYLKIPVEERFVGGAHASVAVDVQMRQRHGRYQLISFSRPHATDYIDVVEWDGKVCACGELTDGDPTTGRLVLIGAPTDDDVFSVRLTPRAGFQHKALVLGFSKDPSSLPLVFRAVAPDLTTPIPVRRVWRGGRYVVVGWSAAELGAINVDIRLAPDQDHARMCEVWFYVVQRV